MRNTLPRDVRRNAAALMRSRARSFFIASLFLPRHCRGDVQIVYAYYRTVDDMVDEPPSDWTRDDILAALDAWESGVRGTGPSPSPLCDALRDVSRRHRIPVEHLTMVVTGARFDLDMRVIETRDELLWYSVQVAGSVGMVMARILGTQDEEALRSACSLGVGMQLTNILRDVGEDLDRGRVYVPRSDLAHRGCSLQSLDARTVTPALRATMLEIMEEARRQYDHGIRGIPRLDPSAQFAITLAARLYGRILDKIARPDFDVFSRRAHLGTIEKWMLAVPAYIQHRSGGLPAHR